MKKILFILFVLTILGQYSCRKALDVNKNPNFPADVTVVQLLPAAEISIGQVEGNYLQIVGGIWAQYWTQNPSSSQYRPLEQYQPGPSSANTAWQELYSGALTDLKQIVAKGGTAANTVNYTAIAKILQAYTFQVLTDNFGDIPFSEALKGEDAGITSPKYDKQEDVYNGIIALAKEGRDLINAEAGGPGAEDVIYHGNMTLWAKFANTLLLRMYLRLAYKNPALAATGIAELQSSAIGFISGPSETAQISYMSNPGNANPLYSEMVNLGYVQNLVASATALDTLTARDDPRRSVFYTSGVGLPQGYYNINPPGSYALPSPAVGAYANSSESATAPVKFISSYESLFLQSEAAARGWLAGAADQLYVNAITANYTEYGLTDREYMDYLDSVYLVSVAPFPATGGTEEKAKAIITEKWIAMTGNQSDEAWIEWRRTGYPTFFTISRTSRIGNQFPQRIPYPETEITRNLNFPGQRNMTEKVWWDAKD